MIKEEGNAVAFAASAATVGTEYCCRCYCCYCIRTNSRTSMFMYKDGARFQECFFFLTAQYSIPCTVVIL